MPAPHPHPWHRGGVYGAGPRVPLCRERRAVWKARLNLFRRARRITPLFEDIGLALLRRLGTDGRLDPSHRTLAEDVGCDERSVRRALEAFKACGLAIWVNRLVRTGWRALQTSNAYALTIGEPPVFSALCTAGQFARQTVKKEILPVPTASVAEVRAAQAALAERRAVIAKRLLTK